MKLRRIQVISAAIISSLFIIVSLVACNKGKVKYNDTTLVRPCEQVICLNGGTCLDGYCQCPKGYEGNQCQTKWSDKFIGNYLADDACDTSNTMYPVVLSADPAYAYKLNISNLGLQCPGNVLYAEINPEKTSFQIPFQKACGNLYISGTGNMNATFINVNLQTRDTLMHTSGQCSILLSKN